MNMLIGILYFAVTFAVLEHGAKHWELRMRRAKFWFLGAGMVQLGAWNFLLACSPALAAQLDWARQAGHICLIVFGALYVCSARRAQKERGL